MVGRMRRIVLRKQKVKNIHCSALLRWCSRPFKARQFLFCSLPTGSGGDWWSEEVTWCNLEEVKVSSYSLLVLTIGKKNKCFNFRVFVLYFRSTSYFWKVIGQADWSLIISLPAGKIVFLFIFELQWILVFARLLKCGLDFNIVFLPR